MTTQQNYQQVLGNDNDNDNTHQSDHYYDDEDEEEQYGVDQKTTTTTLESSALHDSEEEEASSTVLSYQNFKNNNDEDHEEHHHDRNNEEEDHDGMVDLPETAPRPRLFGRGFHRLSQADDDDHHHHHHDDNDEEVQPQQDKDLEDRENDTNHKEDDIMMTTPQQQQPPPQRTNSRENILDVTSTSFDFDLEEEDDELRRYAFNFEQEPDRRRTVSADYGNHIPALEAGLQVLASPWRSPRDNIHHNHSENGRGIQSSFSSHRQSNKGDNATNSSDPSSHSHYNNSNNSVVTWQEALSGALTIFWETFQTARMESRRKRAEQMLALGDEHVLDRTWISFSSWCDLTDRGTILIPFLFLTWIFITSVTPSQDLRTWLLFMGLPAWMIRFLWHPIYWYVWGRPLQRKRQATMDLYDQLNSSASQSPGGGAANGSGGDINPFVIPLDEYDLEPSTREQFTDEPLQQPKEQQQEQGHHHEPYSDYGFEDHPQESVPSPLRSSFSIDYEDPSPHPTTTTSTGHYSSQPSSPTNNNHDTTFDTEELS